MFVWIIETEDRRCIATGETLDEAIKNSPYDMKDVVLARKFNLYDGKY